VVCNELIDDSLELRACDASEHEPSSKKESLFHSVLTG
jgi:hypothetical protein